MSADYLYQYAAVAPKRLESIDPEYSEGRAGEGICDALVNLRRQGVSEVGPRGMLEHIHRYCLTARRIGEAALNIEDIQSGRFRREVGDIGDGAEAALLARCQASVRHQYKRYRVIERQMQRLRTDKMLDELYERCMASREGFLLRIKRAIAWENPDLENLDHHAQAAWCGFLEQFVFTRYPYGIAVVVRHGVTEANKRGELAEPAEPLSPEGKERTEARAKALRRLFRENFGNVDYIVSSPLQRARQTAEAHAAAWRKKRFLVNQGFGERVFDENRFRHVSSQRLSLYANSPDDVLRTEHGKTHLIRADGMESPKDLCNRTRMAAREECGAHRGQTGLWIAHGSSGVAALGGIDPLWAVPFAEVVQLPDDRFDHDDAIIVEFPTAATNWLRRLGYPDLPRIPGEDFIHGTPLERRLLLFRKRLVTHRSVPVLGMYDPAQMETETSKELTGEHYAFRASYPPDRRSVYHLSGVNGDYFSVQLNLYGPAFLSGVRRYVQLQKSIGRYIILSMPVETHQQMLPNLPLPPRFNDAARVPYRHYYSDGLVYISGYIGYLPPQVIEAAHSLLDAADPFLQEGLKRLDGVAPVKKPWPELGAIAGTKGQGPWNYKGFLP